MVGATGEPSVELKSVRGLSLRLAAFVGPKPIPFWWKIKSRQDQDRLDRQSLMHILQTLTQCHKRPRVTQRNTDTEKS